MKRLKYHIIFSIFIAFYAHSQVAVEVPDHIYFAGMRLNLSKPLRNNIAAQIQTLQKNKTYFQAKVDLANMYFPIIERVFTEEDIPVDFKYLAIQESSLQSDVVSSSNAVGYWQFKRESATEVGMLVNSQVDERKHITESSRGAARYLKKNYLVTTNWIYALIAYNTGLGGAKAYIDNKYVGAQEMDLDNDLHWYAVKFLAHKLAYEDKVGYGIPTLSLLEYNKETQGKTIAKLSEITGIGEDKLLNYNKWLSVKHIPDDKVYTVLLPVNYLEREQVAARLGIDLSGKAQKPIDPAVSQLPVKVKTAEQTGTDNKKFAEEVFLFTTNNGLDGVIARETDNVAKLAFAGRVSIEKFRQYNEMERFEEVKKGQVYYFESKNSKAIIPFHTVKAGESLWDIAQIYGIKIAQLKKKNRMEEGEALQEGRLLYLRFKRPDKEPIIIAEKPAPKPVEKIEPTPEPQPVFVKKEVLDTAKTKPVITTTAAINTSVEKMPAVVEPATPTPVAATLPVINFSGADVKTPAKDTSTAPKPTFQKQGNSLPDSSFCYHVVQQGQTLYSLARYYGTKADSIKLWNSIGSEGIKFDQRIIVSKNQTGLKKDFNTLISKQGQDINSLAVDYGIAPEKIILWNDKKNNNLMPGELIKIKK